MRRTWEWLGLNLGKRAGTVALSGCWSPWGWASASPLLRFTTSNSDYLNTNDPAWINNVNYEKVFGGDPIAVLFTMKPGTTVDNLLTQQNQAEFTQHLQAGWPTDPWVFSAVTPMDALKFAQKLLSSPTGSPLDSPPPGPLSTAVPHGPDPADKQARPVPDTRTASLAKTPPADQVLSNPKWMTSSSTSQRQRPRVAADLRPRQPPRPAGRLPEGRPQHQPGDHRGDRR